MVTTRAQEISTGNAGGQRHGAERPAAGPSMLLDGTPALLPPQVCEDRLAALTVQVQSLVAAVQVLQQQPEPLPSVAQPSRHSSQGRSPAREACHPRVAPRSFYREGSKRRRSPSRHDSASPRRWRGREVERPRQHHRHLFPLSGSSREGSFNGRIARRAERRLDEYNQKLEELCQRQAGGPQECGPPNRRATRAQEMKNR